MRLRIPDNETPDDGNVLKRRLLGAAVLIAVAVIALPLLLDGAGSESRFRRVEQLRQEPPRIIDSSATPQTAAAPAVTKPDATGASTEPASVPEQIAVAPARPKPLTSTPVKPDPAEAPLPVHSAAQSAAQSDSLADVPAEAVAEPSRAAATTATQSSAIVDQVAWVVQAGSYTAEENALALRARLRAAGFPSFVSGGRNQGAAVFRVKVGPLNNRQQATKVQSEVESLLGQSTLIRKYP